MNFHSLFKKTIVTRNIFFILTDVILIAVSVWLAFLIRFDGLVPAQYLHFIFETAGLAIIFTIPIFYSQGLYSFSWSYVSASELISLFKATSISFLFLGAAIYISKDFTSFATFPRSIIFISYIFVFVLCGALRFAKRIYLHIIGSNRLLKKEKILIIGAGDAGEQILRSMFSAVNSPYTPVGFIDDSSIKQNITIHGLRVLGKIEDIQKIVKKYQIEQMVIALPSASGKTIKNAIENGKKAGLKKIKITPPITEIINGHLSLRSLKDVGVEDLLGRERVSLEIKQIENFIKDKVVLITGAAGSIGSELSRQTAKFNPSLLMLLDQDETGIFNISEELKNKFPHLEIKSLVANILDRKKIEEVFKNFGPKIIFHAAAYKHVPLMEAQPDEAVKNNIFAVKNLAQVSLETNVEKFIFISTDKAVNPTSVMGATKRVGEMICQAYNQKNNVKFISVRFGNVLNSRGSVMPTFKEQIRKGGPVEVTHPKMKRYLMLISEACLLVVQAGSMGKGGEVFVLDMGEPVKILDLAKEMIKLSGLELDKDIAIVFTKPRPGEKLFEEILTAEEGTVATQNQKIFMANLSNIDSVKLEKKIEELKKIVGSPQDEKIISILRSFLPHYKPFKG
ncbi:MAG: Polysaccharide biosynthesis protein CapD [Parcubacteria group bacterium GW2011_GWA2_37_10]|nr:MAG: Polysaccharide biosynthesis protein CapD [Parcubacteria group bacterium GW2011_GWA2_37_10]